MFRCWFAIFCLLCVPLSAQDPRSVVRVLAGNSLGSGTVIYRSENGDAYVLTNYHVAGRRGSRVGVEFWDNGVLVPRIPGIVVQSSKDSSYIDVAIIRIAAADLAGLDPPYIPLAAQGSKVGIDAVIQSRGCPGGSWPCQFVGHAKQTDKYRVEFWPRPGGGRSGSSVLVQDHNEVAGLLTWSADKPSQESHDSDGSDYRSGFGIAQQIDMIWSVIRGQNVSTGGDLPQHYEPLIDYLINPQELEADDPEEAAKRWERFRRFMRRWRGYELPPEPPDSTPPPKQPPVDPPAPDFSNPQGNKGKQDEPPPPNDPRSPYAKEMERHSQEWSKFETSEDDRWTDYASAYERAQEHKRPVLIMLTLPGCAACDSLKVKLKDADTFGWFNNTETCLIDAARDTELASKFAPSAYPMLVYSEWDDSGKLLTKATHVGDFPLESKRNVLGAIIGDPTMYEWLVMHEVR